MAFTDWNSPIREELGWRDIDIFFNKAPTGDLKHMEDVDAIKNSLINIMETIQGSRRMLPEFALPLHNILFDPIDDITANKLGNEILIAIERWDNRVAVRNVHVHADIKNQMYNIKLTFKMLGRNEIETLDYVLRRI